MNSLLSIFKQPKMQLLLLLLLLAVTGTVAGADVEAKLLVLMTALTAAVLAEWAFFGAIRATSLQSAAISGLIIGMLVAPGGSLLVAWSAAVIAIASKKLLMFREEKHIFNPAAFGLMTSVLVFGNKLNWWGNSSVLLLILGAGLLMFRLHRLSLPFSYFVARAGTAALFGGFDSLTGTLLIPNLFFAFIMLVEPKTSPGKRSEQWVFGGLCGVLATVYYRYLPAYEGDLLALLSVNLLRPLLMLRSWLGGFMLKYKQAQNGGQET